MWRAFKPTNNYFYSALYCYVPVKMRASQIDTGSTSSLSYGQRPDPQSPTIVRRIWESVKKKVADSGLWQIESELVVPVSIRPGTPSLFNWYKINNTKHYKSNC